VNGCTQAQQMAQQMALDGGESSPAGRGVGAGMYGAVASVCQQVAKEQQLAAATVSHNEVVQQMTKVQQMAAVMAQQQQPQQQQQQQQQQQLAAAAAAPAAPGVPVLPTGTPGLAGGPSSGLAGLPTYAPGNWQTPAGQCTPAGQWGPGSASCQPGLASAMPAQPQPPVACVGRPPPPHAAPSAAPGYF
jgi:hypothetical protein